MLISELSAQSEIPRDTIRYYEKTAGFTLAEIADMLDTFQQGGYQCTGLKTTFAEKISRIDEKISSLENQKRSIQKSMEDCDSDCSVNDGLPSCMSC